MIGSTISYYKIIEKLGEGGMGVVYKAQDTALDRFVALKLLPPHVSASPDDKARFIQEAKAAAAQSRLILLRPAGLCLEFANRLITSPIQKIILFRLQDVQ